MKPLIVGESNPYGSDPRYALYSEPQGSAGWRLCKLVMGLTTRQYISMFDRTNLCERRWSGKEARTKAANILAERGDAPIILCGSKVCRTFDLEFEPFTVQRRDEHVFVIIPHPSGLSRLWNEFGAYERARRLLQDVGALPAPAAELQAAVG